MQIRRPLAALLTALALVGGGATMTACSDADVTTPNEGTTEDDSSNTDEENDLPDNTDPDPSQDLDDDTSDPD